MSAEPVRVLVVDDTPANRYAVSRTLRGEGFDVIEAGLGGQALELVRSQHPDLVVLDVNLPDMLGFEVARRLRADPETSAVSILQLSATFTGAEAHAHGLGMGADAYLVHPFDPLVLVATARALVRLRSAERSMHELLVLERAARQEADRARQVAEQAEAALRSSEARFRRLSESGLIGLVRWRPSGRILAANDAFLSMVGHTRAELEAETLDMHGITAPESAAAMQKSQEQLCTAGVFQHVEQQLVRKDGTRVDVLLAGAMLEDTQEVLTMALDITARVRTEHERTRLLGELERAIRTRDEFLAIASHDLRNPLSTLRLQLEVLATLSEGGPEVLATKNLPARIESARNQVKELSGLLDDLLDTSHIASGHLDVQRARMDLAEVARSVSARMRDQFTARGCALRVKAEHAVVGDWDRLRLEQVLSNLLSNALKYGAGRPVDVSVDVVGTHAQLVVRDRGEGIAPENLERIFGQFERIHAARDTKSFGLGLWIVQRVVSALGGRISVESELGRGSTFRVELPLVDNAGR